MPEVFQPFSGGGTPLEDQFKSFKDLVRTPYDKEKVDAYTRCRVILMNGIENGGVVFLHEFARMTYNEEIKGILALLRRVESQHQTLVDWLNPANQSVIETTIAFEQVAVDLTANLAQNEPDPVVKAQLDFALLEDFDHLYRYANLMKRLQGSGVKEAFGAIGGNAARITQERTDIKEGRPTAKEHRHPYDTLRKSYSKGSADIKTKLNQATITFAEQETMNFYREHGNMYEDPLARQLYAEIAEVEEEHVTGYESLADASMTWLERLALYQINEAYNYFSCWKTEIHPDIKPIWEQLYRHELEHVALAAELLKKHEGKDIHQMVPGSISPLIEFRPNKEYIDKIIAEQRDWQYFNMEVMPASKLPADWPSYAYEKQVRGTGFPSEEAVKR
jgi:rubrerythrin